MVHLNRAPGLCHTEWIKAFYPHALCLLKTRLEYVKDLKKMIIIKDKNKTKSNIVSVLQTLVCVIYQNKRFQKMRIPAPNNPSH